MAIEAIGWMIGIYVITRMVSFLTREGERGEASIVKLMATVTIVATLAIMIYLLISGISNA